MDGRARGAILSNPLGFKHHPERRVLVGGGCVICFCGIFTPDPWGNWSNLTSIFFRWVETQPLIGFDKDSFLSKPIRWIYSRCQPRLNDATGVDQLPKFPTKPWKTTQIYHVSFVEKNILRFFPPTKKQTKHRTPEVNWKSSGVVNVVVTTSFSLQWTHHLGLVLGYHVCLGRNQRGKDNDNGNTGVLGWNMGKHGGDNSDKKMGPCWGWDVETARTGLLFWVSIDKSTNITGVEL